MKKRAILNSILTVVFLICLSLFAVFTINEKFLVKYQKIGIAGGYAGGDGSEEYPFLIETSEQFTFLSEQVNSTDNYSNNKFFKLTADIDLSGYGKNYNGGAGLAPIGNDIYIFQGNFDGNGYAVTNLYINQGFNDYVGLFGYIGNDAVIKNLGVKGFVLGVYAGGIAGYSCGTIENCYNASAVTGNDYAGGIAGYSCGTIDNCYNEGFVTGNQFAGGIAGQNGGSAKKGTIGNCYNTGSVTGNQYAGGITGQSGTGEIESLIESCYNAGLIKGLYSGGIIGYEYNTTYINCFYDYNIFNGNNVGFGPDSGKTTSRLTTSQMTSAGVLTGLLAALQSGTSGKENQWVKRENDLSHIFYPELKVFAGDGGVSFTAPQAVTDIQTASKESVKTFLWSEQNAGGADNPFEIYNEKQLKQFSDTVNARSSLNGKNIKLKSDIDLSYYGNGYNEGAGWTPIGSNAYKFRSNFDGNGYSIKNLYINLPAAFYAGLFGCVGSDGVVKNLNVEGSINGNNYTGGITGQNMGTITNCKNLSAVTGLNATGGIVGYNDGGLISNCNNEGFVNGSINTGGIAGYNIGGTVINCRNTGDITITVTNSMSSIGGIIANNNKGTIINCHNSSKIVYSNNLSLSGSVFVYYVGGVAALNSGIIENSYNSGDIECDNSSPVARDNVTYYNYIGGVAASNDNIIENCYNLGNVSCKLGNSVENGSVYSNHCGGITGFDGGEIINCYNLGNINGSNSSYTGGIAGRSYGKILSCYNIGTISGKGYIGGLSGVNYGIIEDSYNSGNIDCNLSINAATFSNYTGGISSYNRGEIINCYNTGNITGNGLEYTGGITGLNNNKVIGCYNLGNIAGTGMLKYTGGIAGTNNGPIADCYNVGVVSGKNHTGGITGINNVNCTIENSFNKGLILGNNSSAIGTGGMTGINDGTIKNCYNTGFINGNNYAGGITGQNGSSSYNGIIENCYSAGSITGLQYGGIIGYARNSTLLNCFYNSDIFVGNAIGGTVSQDPETKLTNLQMTYANVLQSGEAMGTFSLAWVKRNAGFEDNYCYFPELAVFYNSDNEIIRAASKDSVKLQRIIYPDLPDNLTSSSIKYGQELSNSALPEISKGILVWKDGSLNEFSAGVRKSAAIFISDYDYYLPTEVEISFIVMMIDGEVTVSIEGWVYNAESNLPSSAIISGDYLNPSYMYKIMGTDDSTYTYTVPTAAGEYTVRVIYDATLNYYAAFAAADFSISKAFPAYIPPTGLTAVCGDTLNDVTLPDGFSWKDPGMSVGNAGENQFIAIFTPSDTDNYAIAELFITVTVTNKYGQVTVNIDNWVYGTKANLPSSAIISGDYLNSSYMYKIKGMDDSMYTYDVPTAAGEYTVRVTYEATLNYYAAFAIADFSITKAFPIYVPPVKLAAVCGETLNNITLPNGFSWKDPGMSVGEAGENQFIAIFTPSDTGNYIIVEFIITITVTDKTYPRTDPKGDDLSFLGLPYGVTAGILTGIIIFLIILCVTILLLIRKKRKSK